MMNIEKKLEREMSILHTLKNLDLATRSQLQAIHRLGSNRNASRVLKNMEQYLNHFQDREMVYYLNKKGRELVGSTKIINKTLQFHHTLMRNDIYIHYNCPKQWRNEYTIVYPPHKIIADAVFRADGKDYFLEVDHLQKMGANKEKINLYKGFKESQLWQNRNNGMFPTLLYYTSSESRRNPLLELGNGLDFVVFTKKDLSL